MKASEAVVMYHVDTRKKYNLLMELFNKENISWTTGPVSFVNEVNVDFWGVFQHNTCIATNGVSLSYGSIVRYEEQGYDIIEFNSSEDFVTVKITNDVIYQVRSEGDLNELLARLKKVGYMWASGRDLVNDSLVSWHTHGIYTCIHVHSDQKWLSYSDLDFFVNELEIPVELYTKGMRILK